MWSLFRRVVSTVTSVSPSDALDRAIHVRESFDLPRWGGYASQPWVREERHKNIRARTVGSPRVAEIIAIRLGCVSNTGALVVHMESADGEIWQWLCNGHAAGARLRVDDVRRDGKGQLEPRRLLEPHEISSWSSYPQDADDDSPPVYQPNHQLVVSTRVTECPEEA